MLKDYLRSNFRAVLKNRGQSLINVLGLTLGIICTIVIFITVRFELSFDNYHTNAGRIYRFVIERNRFGEIKYDAGLTYPFPEAVRQDFPDVELVTITDSNVGPPVIGIAKADGSKALFKELYFTFADPEYFRMFDYEWVEGSPSDGLSREKTVVLSQSVARKYFGNAPALNRVISYNAQFDFTVTGVVKDPPPNSSFPFTVFFSNRLGADKHGWDKWTSTSSSINCYAMLKKGVRAEDFEKKLKNWHLKYFTGEDKEEGENIKFSLQPFTEVHFDKRFGTYGGRIVSYQTLLALSLIGALLFITACINFVNLNTVLIINRAKEVGVRKVLGGGRLQIVFQFLGETFLVTLTALIISVGLMEIVLVNLQPVLGFKPEFKPLADPVVGVFIMALPFVITLLAGLYPALSLAAFQPIKALKSKMYSGSAEGTLLRRALIAVQLIIAQGLVISTIIIIQQLNMFMSQPMGLNSSAVVEFDLPEQKGINLTDLKGRILTIPGVQYVSMSNTGSASDNSWNGDFTATVRNTEEDGFAEVKFGDEDFLKTYELTLAAGRGLIRSDTANLFIVNEAFVRSIGIADNADAIGTPVKFWGMKSQIEGVVKDFNTNSLRNGIKPVIIMTRKSSYYMSAVKLETGQIKEIMARVEKMWKESYPNYVFEYTFLDETIRHFYDAERRTSKLVSLFAVVAILIGSMGLLGLVSFLVTKRTKEVGIRKALGASVGSIMALFSKEFVILIALAFLIAAPASYYIMSGWLDNFAYRIQPGVLTYVMGMSLSVVVVLGTVGYMSYKAAIANPVLALKDE